MAKIQAHFTGLNIKVKSDFDRALIKQIKDTGVASWDKKTKIWTLKPSIDALRFLVENRVPLDDKDMVRLAELLDKALSWKKDQKFREVLSKATWAPPIPAIRQLIDWEPEPYQWCPAHYATFCDARFLLADEQRMGKCRESILVTLHPKFRDHPVIIFCPSYVVETWQKELFKAFGINSYAVDGPMDQLVPGYRYYVASYERMRQIDLLNWFVIIDESHNVKTTSSIRGKEAKRIGHGSEHVILMTGTPIVNRPLELFNQLTIIDPTFLEYNDYTSRFCGAKWTPFGRNVQGSSNLTGLHRLVFSNYAVRREREQVWLTKIIKQRETIDLGNKPPNPNKTVLAQLAENARDKAQDQDFILWLTQIITTNKKVLLFAHHKEMLEALELLCSKLRIRYIRISGGMEGGAKDGEVQRFQNDPNINVAILGITAASEGVSLSASKLVVFCEPPHTPGRLKQAEDRTIGFQETETIRVLLPVYSKIERSAYKRILKKATIQEIAINGEDDDDEDCLMSEIAADLGIPHKKSKIKLQIEESMPA